jgi:hypothetical protein
MKPDLQSLRNKIKNSLSNPIVRRDSTYIGGQMLGDILLGCVSDTDLDPSVLEAYKLQYPDLSQQQGFVETVKGMNGDDEALRGLASGVKGKLFEVEYRDYLNNGHLHDGYHAELAESANQPGWDLAIYKSDGTIDDQIQLKATETLENVKTHLERYPDVDVAVTSDQAQAVHAAGLDADVHAVPLDGPGLDHQVDSAMDHAAQGLGWHLPLIGYALLGGEAIVRAVKGNPMGLGEATGRGTKTTLAALAGQGVFMLTGTAWASVPAAILARTLMEKDRKLESYKTFVDEEIRWGRNRGLAHNRQ